MTLLARLRGHRATEMIRFYQAAIINTVFGYGVYALLITQHVNMYAAQLTSYIAGTVFNYFTYSRHAFPDAAPAKLRFVAAYIGNYLVNLALLKLFDLLLRSPYLIGVMVALSASLMNYFVLRHIVFARRPA